MTATAPTQPATLSTLRQTALRAALTDPAATAHASELAFADTLDATHRAAAVLADRRGLRAETAAALAALIDACAAVAPLGPTPVVIRTVLA